MVGAQLETVAVGGIGARAMKHLALGLCGIFAVSGSLARAESLSKLFDSSQLWEAPAKPKAVVAKKKKKVEHQAVRAVASEPAVEQTYVYADTYSFQKNSAENNPDRDIASVSMKGRVISVRREIALTEAAAKTINQEFVINAGARLGVSEGDKLKVYRNLPVVDPYNGNKQYELKVDFALVEIIHVEDDIAVAQLVKMTEPAKGAYVGLRGILVGDYIAVR